MAILPKEDMERRLMAPRYVNDPVEVSLSTSTARSTVLAAGLYVIHCDVTAHIEQGGSTVEATTSSRVIEAGLDYAMEVTSAADGYIAGILGTGTGTLQAQLLEAA